MTTFFDCLKTYLFNSFIFFSTIFDQSLYPFFSFTKLLREKSNLLAFCLKIAIEFFETDIILCFSSKLILFKFRHLLLELIDSFFFKRDLLFVLIFHYFETILSVLKLICQSRKLYFKTILFFFQFVNLFIKERVLLRAERGLIRLMSVVASKVQESMIGICIDSQSLIEFVDFLLHGDNLLFEQIVFSIFFIELCQYFGGLLLILVEEIVLFIHNFKDFSFFDSHFLNFRL